MGNRLKLITTVMLLAAFFSPFEADARPARARLKPKPDPCFKLSVSRNYIIADNLRHSNRCHTKCASLPSPVSRDECRSGCRNTYDQRLSVLNTSLMGCGFAPEPNFNPAPATSYRPQPVERAPASTPASPAVPSTGAGSI